MRQSLFSPWLGIWIRHHRRRRSSRCCWSAGLKAMGGGVRAGVARRAEWSVWAGKVGERKLHKSNQLTKELKANGPQLPSLYLPPTTPCGALCRRHLMCLRMATWWVCEVPHRGGAKVKIAKDLYLATQRKKEKKNVLLAVNPSLPMPRLNNPLQE